MQCRQEGHGANGRAEPWRRACGRVARSLQRVPDHVDEDQALRSDATFLLDPRY